MALVGDYYYRQMKRLESGSRFLTFSCYHRLPLFRNDAIKDAFVTHLLAVRDKGLGHFRTWVVMPDHVHLLLTPARGVTGRYILTVLKSPFARGVIGRWHELNAQVLKRIRDGSGYHFWQPGGGHDRNIWSTDELMEKARYIELNPVRRGLCERAEDWKWSSCHPRFAHIDRTARPEDGPVAPGDRHS